MAAGPQPFAPSPLYFVAGKLLGANMNITTDQAINIAGPSSLYTIASLYFRNASVSPAAAVGGLWTGANKTGTNLIVPSNIGYASLTPTVPMWQVPYTAGRITAEFTGPATVYLSLATAAGVAATCDIYVIGCDIAKMIAGT